ncbi:MAG: hypothetical protein U0271_38210 [Polyangiaceae bacterium]
MTLGRVTFHLDDLTQTFDGVALWLYHLDGATADWNLGGGEAPWLSGLASPSPQAISAPSPTDRSFEVEVRSLDEAIEALSGGAMKTHYPVGDACEMRVRHHGEVAEVVLDVELDWDVYPLPAPPPDYRRRHLRVEGTVPVRAGTGA